MAWSPNSRSGWITEVIKATWWREGCLKGGPLSSVEVEAWGSVAEDGNHPVGSLARVTPGGRDGDNKGEIPSLKLRG